MYYVPRKLNNYDPIYGADDVSSYEEAIPIEMYIKSIDGFTGDGNFMSKFGLEIRDQVIFSVARRIFAEEVGSVTSLPRPNEGDIVFFPLNKKCFQIKYVKNLEMFYQLGSIQTWELTCELFEYSNEKFNTGIPEIDLLQTKFSQNQMDWSVTNETGEDILTEDSDFVVNEKAPKMPGADNDKIQLESDTFVDWSEIDPFSERSI